MKIRPVGAVRYMQADGWMDRHDEADSRFSQFCEGAWKLARSSVNTLRNPMLSGSWHPGTWRPHIAEVDEGLLTEVKGEIIPVRAMKSYGGAEVQIHSFLT